MASTYSFSTPNELAAVTVMGRVAKVRLGEGDYAGKVANISVAFTRRYPEMKDGVQIKDAEGKDSWKEQTSFVEFALWGKAAASFHANPGDVCLVGFNISDLTANAYTNKEGILGANLKCTRAEFVKIIARKDGATTSNGNGNGHTEQVEVPEEIVTL